MRLRESWRNISTFPHVASQVGPQKKFCSSIFSSILRRRQFFFRYEKRKLEIGSNSRGNCELWQSEISLFHIPYIGRRKRKSFFQIFSFFCFPGLLFLPRRVRFTQLFLEGGKEKTFLCIFLLFSPHYRDPNFCTLNCLWLHKKALECEVMHCDRIFPEAFAKNSRRFLFPLLHFCLSSILFFLSFFWCRYPPFGRGEGGGRRKRKGRNR